MKRLLRIQSLTNQEVIADKTVEATRFLDRLFGLMGRRKFEAGEAMYFPDCNDIHMWFMRIPIDVVFAISCEPVGGDSRRRVRVVSVHENVRPWKALPLREGRAQHTIELPVGTIARYKIQPGDELCLS